jgi:Arc/MetJ-type ribon-helix-helix transcriptional regulator
MSTDITSIRLPNKDTTLIEHFIDTGEFKSRSDFVRYAVKKTLNEMLLKEIQEKMLDTGPMTKKKVTLIQKEIKDIRKMLWEQYAQHIS